MTRQDTESAADVREAEEAASHLLSTTIGKLLAGGGLVTLIGAPLWGTMQVSGSTDRMSTIVEAELQKLSERTENVGEKLDGVKEEVSGLRQDFRVEQSDVRRMLAETALRQGARMDLFEQRLQSVERQEKRTRADGDD